MAERPVYEALAASAGAAGFENVTASQVHRWVRDRLLPATGHQVALGRPGFRTVRSPAAEAQLLALCAWRRQTKRLDELAVLLWADGWDVPIARIRRTLITFGPKSLPNTTGRAQRADLHEQLEEMAYKFAPRVKAHFGRRGVEREQIAEALLPLLQVIAGLGGRIRKADARVLESLTGVNRGRTDSANNVAPWLQTPPLEAAGLATEFSLASVTDMTANATDQELDHARRRVRFWLSDAPELARRLGQNGDPEFAGLHVLASFRPNRAVEALVLMLFFDRLGLSSSQDELIAGLSEIIGSHEPGR